MANTTFATPNASLTPTPYQLDIDQTLKASKALLKHVQEEARRLQENSLKKNLLATADEDSDYDATPENDLPIWLTLTTKQHIVDKARLAPKKIQVPHTLNKSSSISICLITADPQRAVKNVVADPSFPPSLYSRINKVIGFSKLKARYRTFESKRQLLAEYDIFLADERIVTRLVEVLGKTFYKGTAKRPIPIKMAPDDRIDGKRVKADPKKSKSDKTAAVASPSVVAAQIEKALTSVPVTPRPGTQIAVRVGLASFTPQQLMENIKVVAPALIERHVVKGWRNIKGIHIKAPDSIALPIWLADELWVGDEKVLDEAEEAATLEAKPKEKKRKRNPQTTSGPQAGARKKVKAEVEEEEEREMAVARKARLADQKKQAFEEGARLSATIKA